MRNWKDNRYFTISIYAFFVVAASMVLLMLVQHFDRAVEYAGRILDILAPFLWGFCFAYVLNYPYKWLLKTIDKIPKIGKKMSDGAKKAVAIILVYVAFIAILVLFFYAVAPQIVTAISDFIKKVPSYMESLSINVQAFLYSYLEKYDLSMNDIFAILDQQGKLFSQSFDINKVLNSTMNIVLATSVKLKNIFLGLVVSVYFLLDKERFKISCKKLLYATFSVEKSDEILEILRFTDKTFGGFLIVKIVDSTIIAILNYIFMSVMRMEYAVLISVLVGVTNIIPFLGPFIGAIPSVFLLLLINPWHALIFTIFIIILQQFEANFLEPKLMGNTMGIRAVFVVFAVIVFGGLFGVVGMFVGVPVFVVLYKLFSESVARRLREKNVKIK